MVETVTDPQELLENAIQQCVSMGSGIPGQRVIPGREAPRGPIIKELFATVFVVEADPTGSAWQVPSPDPEDEMADDVIESTMQPYTALVSVQFFRRGAHGAAQKAHLWFPSPLGTLECDKRGLTFIRASRLRNLTEIESEQWEQRWGFDLHLAYAITSEKQNLGRIDSVEIRLCAEDPRSEDTVTVRADTPPQAAKRT